MPQVLKPERADAADAADAAAETSFREARGEEEAEADAAAAVDSPSDAEGVVSAPPLRAEACHISWRTPHWMQRRTR